MKRWKCTVCGYIHTGDGPPDRCPVCGTGPDKFVEVVDEAGEKIESSGLLSKLGDKISKHHLHPIAVHFPNGVIPVCVLFVVLALALDNDTVAKAAFYNLLFVLASLPLVLLFGIVDWKKRYDGKMARAFKIKASGGTTVFLLALLLVLWHVADPEVVDRASAAGWVYFALHLVMLGAVAITGHQGGKLVYHEA